MPNLKLNPSLSYPSLSFPPDLRPRPDIRLDLVTWYPGQLHLASRALGDPVTFALVSFFFMLGHGGMFQVLIKSSKVIWNVYELVADTDTNKFFQSYQRLYRW